MRKGVGIKGWRSILRFRQWLMWGVGIQKVNIFIYKGIEGDFSKIFIECYRKFVKEKYEANDEDGEMTVQCLKNCRKILYRINSSNPSSLGLHPAIYLYSINGRFKTTSFYVLLHFMNVLEKNKGFDKFIECRELLKN